MKPDRIEEYVEKVYGYAVSHTYSREEADELSQEILLTALRELPKLREDGKFEPWLWGVAKNVTRSFSRNMGKRRATYFYDIPDYLACAETVEDDDRELYDSLRTKITMLSKSYRDIIILHYYDGLSTKAISEKLSIPEGTVTWRLSEARKKIKKGFDEMNETALRPVRMNLNIYGNGDYDGNRKPFPDVYIRDALSQNILYHAYEQPRTVEELAELCGVPAYYIEDSIQNLLNRDAVLEVGKGKVRTNFVIWSDKYGIYCETHAKEMLAPVADRILSALTTLSHEAMQIDFYKAEKSEADLFYLFAVLAFSHASKTHCKLPFPYFKKRYDGNDWSYLGDISTGAHKQIGIGVQKSSNFGSRGKYAYTVFNGLNGFAYRTMMYDNYINVCEDLLLRGETEDLESLANAIKDGYIVKRPDGSLFVTTPMFTPEQTARFHALVETHLFPHIPDYADCVNRFLDGYKKLFPKHLQDDADRLCHAMFVGMLSVLLEQAQQTGTLEMPSENQVCDVLQQFK